MEDNQDTNKQIQKVPVLDINYKKEYVTAIEAKKYLQKIWENCGHLLKLLYGCLDVDMENPTNIFFLDVIAVPPSRFRPPMVLSGNKYESSQTSGYVRVLQDCEVIHEILQTFNERGINPQTETEDSERDEKLKSRLQVCWLKLQGHVNAILDSNLDPNKVKLNGIKQILEKKNGLFRKHMMGKRVNFAARSVITPDPNISVTEIGIPELFAKTLTYPQPVTPWNVHELRKMVINGPDVYPGAESVVDQRGVKRRLFANNRTGRESIANQLLTPSTTNNQLVTCKKVNRHLLAGDYLLLNRQPTLHKPSIQAHRARIIPNIKTFRLHYANCKAYNADFDGDEMTAHFPQTELGRAEAMEIANAHNQYVVPKDGTPLAGLIQDHIIAGVRLTIRGRFFKRSEYNQLVFGALVDKTDAIKMVRPAIIKPERLWSGKQLISTLLYNIIPNDKPHITMDSSAKIAEKLWGFTNQNSLYYNKKISDDMGESNVIIRDSELLCGVLDKSQYGATAYGLVHCCYELYGGEVAARLLTCFGKLFTCFLQMVGFSLGIKDILMTKYADDHRQYIVDSIKRFNQYETKDVLQMDIDDSDEAMSQSVRKIMFGKNDRSFAELDNKIKNITNQVQNDILRATMPKGLLCKFPENNLQLMVNSGAKGSSVNTMQMSCLLGQIELEGRRPPMMISGRFLPSFLQYDISPVAGGFVTGRFLTGITPQEYFIHCMAGREGLIDTAVKTSRSGYLQRCLVKHLEGVIVNYDLTVRDSDSSVIQFYYGEDSLDVTKTQFIHPKHFPLLIKNRSRSFNQQPPPQQTDATDFLPAQEQIYKSNQLSGGATGSEYKLSPFLLFCRKKEGSVEEGENTARMAGRSPKSVLLCQLWYKMSAKKRQRYMKKIHRCPEPVMSKTLPYRQKWAVSEELFKTSQDYCSTKNNPMICPIEKAETKEKITADNFKKLINHKFQQCLVQPGESVGLISAQSVGEPSTQMTLNTFHFAGCGAMNVTLGIPRLRECLMTNNSNIKTPTMDIPVMNTSVAMEEAKKLQQKLSRVTLEQVLEKVEVTDRIEMTSKLHHRLYIVRFSFLPPNIYDDQISTSPTDILNYMENKYIPNLLATIRKNINVTQDSILRVPRNVLRIGRANLQADSEVPEEGAERPEEGAEGPEEGAERPEEDDETEIHAVEALQSASDDGEDDEEDNASANKRRMQQTDEHDYDEGDANEADSEAEEEESKSSDEEAEKSKNLEEPTEEEHDPNPQLDVSQKRKNLKKFDVAIHNYKYDRKDSLWCEVTYKFNVQLTKIDLLTIIKSHIKSSIIYEVPGITRCILTDVKTPYGTELHLQTEGINIPHILKFSHILEVNRIFCNNQHVMTKFFGIEAGLKVIIKEIQSVFAVYGIKVDYRHLSLIADFMTFEGEFRAFDRNHMEICPSPFQQISFESACHFLSKATASGHRDSLLSPSSRLVTGKLLSSGTGYFDLRVPLVFVK